MNIGSLILPSPVFLAPMAGITDPAFRLVARLVGDPVLCTEMISAEGICRDNRGTRMLLSFDPREHPVFVQIFGSNPAVMAEAAARCQALGFDGVDINLGCPVRKVAAHGAGAALMRDPQRAEAVVAAVRRAISLPLTAKLRSGWSGSELNAVEVGLRLAGAGIDAVTLHPRTRNQYYSGKADWLMIARMVQSLSIPVVGNGDLRHPRDARRMQEETGCAGFMVGRGALGNPWLLSAIATSVQTGADSIPPGYPPAPAEIHKVFCIHLQKMIDWVGSEHRAVLRMRKHVIWYTRGFRGAAALRRGLSGMVRADHMQEALAQFFRDNRREEERETPDT